MKKSIQKKISGNNFNSNYFEFNISGLPSIERYKNTYKQQVDMYNYNLIPSSGTYIHYLSSAQVSWGLQRRLNNYSFIDAKMLVGFSTQWDPNTGADPWYVGINIIFGFGYNVKHK